MKTLLYPLPTNIEDINFSSGTTVSIYKNLKKYFNVVPVGPLFLEKPVIQTGLNFLYKKCLFPYQFATVHNWKTIKGYARQLQIYIDDPKIDAIFASSTIYAAGLKTNKPIFAYADFSFYNGLNYYPFGKNLFPSSQKQALEVDKFCFEKSTKVFLASEWAREETIKAYNLSADKIKVIKRGANLESEFSNNQIDSLIKKRIDGEIKKFLFLGVSWKRKGGDIAVDLVSKIRNLGYNAELQIIGCTPPNKVKELPYVHVFPFLNRQNENDLQTLRNLFSEAFCFILPTQAEAMGIVFAEAASFGLPSISFDTGGVSAAIENNKTGILFSFSERSEIMIERILHLLNNNILYQRMSKNAFEKYKNELNWDIIAQKIKEIVTPIM